MEKCPQCGFERIEESPDECAKCGILFEKWHDRAEQLERQMGSVETMSYPSSLITLKSDQLILVSAKTLKSDQLTLVSSKVFRSV